MWVIVVGDLYNVIWVVIEMWEGVLFGVKCVF